jgi:methyltransferase (TIGR00027 family)
MRFHASVTAEAVCWMRAADAFRRRPLLLDPVARRFLSPLSRALVAVRVPALGRLANFVVGRHVFMDAALADRPDRSQVVLVGAGYDARPWRLGLERCLVVDHPATLARRARKGPSGDGIHVPVDLSREPLDPALEAHGHDPARPTAWVWEGVSMYLPQVAIQATLDTFAARSAPGSQLLMDFWHPVDGAGLGDGVARLAPAALQLLGEPIRYGLHPGDTGAVLARHGFQLVEHGTAEVLQARFGRRFDPSMHVVHGVFGGSYQPRRRDSSVR